MDLVDTILWWFIMVVIGFSVLLTLAMAVMSIKADPEELDLPIESENKFRDRKTGKVCQVFKVVNRGVLYFYTDNAQDAHILGRSLSNFKERFERIQ